MRFDKVSIHLFPAAIPVSFRTSLWLDLNMHIATNATIQKTITYIVVSLIFFLFTVYKFTYKINHNFTIAPHFYTFQFSLVLSFQELGL